MEIGLTSVYQPQKSAVGEIRNSLWAANVHMWQVLLHVSHEVYTMLAARFAMNIEYFLLSKTWSYITVHVQSTLIKNYLLIY